LLKSCAVEQSNFACGKQQIQHSRRDVYLRSPCLLAGAHGSLVELFTFSQLSSVCRYRACLIYSFVLTIAITIISVICNDNVEWSCCACNGYRITDASHPSSASPRRTYWPCVGQGRHAAVIWSWLSLPYTVIHDPIYLRRKPTLTNQLSRRRLHSGLTLASTNCLLDYTIQHMHIAIQYQNLVYLRRQIRCAQQRARDADC